MAARGIGLVAAARGRPQKALEWLREARRRCARLPDAYLWAEAYTLDALCSIAVAHDVQAAPLGSKTSPSSPDGRACARWSRAPTATARGSGTPPALTAARLLAAAIDNPALSAIFDKQVAVA